jgi:hypothetical protein
MFVKVTDFNLDRMFLVITEQILLCQDLILDFELISELPLDLCLQFDINFWIVGGHFNDWKILNFRFLWVVWDWFLCYIVIIIDLST